MTDFPDLKFKALVNFPVRVDGGAGIDVDKQDGHYTIDLDFGDFAPPVAGIPPLDAPNLNALLWNVATQSYLLAPISLLGGSAGIPDAPVDGVIYGRQNAGWVSALPSPPSDFETVAQAQAATISFSVNSLRTRGFAAGGDLGGALYRRVASDPGHPGKFHATDGTWWEMCEAIVNPRMFGGIGDGVTLADSYWQNAIDYIKIRSGGAGGTVDLTGAWAVNTGVDISGISDLTIQASGGRIYFLKTAFSYLHMLRISNCNQIIIDGLDVFSDNTLVRGDTGFSVQITTSTDITVSNCRFTNTATNPIWIDNTTGIDIIGNNINGSKAGGIQLSNACTVFSIEGNTVQQTDDDAIAVVQDTAGTAPSRGTITGNTVNSTNAGHGIVLISCSIVTVTGNTIVSTGAAGIGSYIWSGTTAFANNLTISGNEVFSCGLSSQNANTCCCMLIGGTQDSVISGNVLDSPQGSGFASEIAIIRMTNFSNVTIKGNVLRNSSNYGIYVLDANDATSVKKLSIEDNSFYAIQQCPIRCRPISAGGALSIVDNKFSLSGYSNPSGGVINIANMGTQRVFVAGNKQIDQSYAILIDTATCSNTSNQGNLS